MLYPKDFESKIGFDKIRIKLKNYCLSPLGIENVDKIRFSGNLEFIELLLNQIVEFKHIIDYKPEFPVSNYLDVREALNKMRPEGTFILKEELLQILKSLVSISRIIVFFEKNSEEYPNLSKLKENIPNFSLIIREIERIIDENGEIKDSASPELLEIRTELDRKRRNISKITHKIFKQAQAEGLIESDTGITIRDGKMLIPVNRANKRKIQGLVYDESATGKTSYIEPLEVVEANNDIRELEFDEKREIVRILIAITDLMRPELDNLIFAYQFMGKIDFIRAKAKYAIEINAIKPKTENKPHIDFRHASHPILLDSFKKENKKVVPLDIELTENQRILIISGPNAGGKSVCLKTTGLLQYMFQCGLLITTYENSTCGIFDNIFIDIGDDQSIENDLSTYSSHLQNMKFFVEKGNLKTLILIDEFGTGTEPLLGGAIAESVLEELDRKGTFGVITTHYTNIKHYATSSPNVINGAMLYDTEKMKPRFILETGKPGNSFAFEIATNIGLPKWLLDRASKKLDIKHIEFDKALKEMEADRNFVQDEKKLLIQKEEKLNKQIAEYEEETKKILKQKKEIIAESKLKAQHLLNSVNKQIENTISAIKQVNADKEKTKSLRFEFEEFKNELIEQISDNEKDITEGLKKVTRKEEKVVDFDPNTLETGDKVKLIGQNAVGEILEIKGDKIVVVIGSMQSTVSRKKVEKIPEKEYKKKAYVTTSSSGITEWDVSAKKREFMFGLDVRGNRADEALQKVMEYIDQAIMVDAREVKILHGTGNGILRTLIRDYLKSIDVVKSCKDERVEQGGSGITVVEFGY